MSHLNHDEKATIAAALAAYGTEEALALSEKLVAEASTAALRSALVTEFGRAVTDDDLRVLACQWVTASMTSDWEPSDFFDACYAGLDAVTVADLACEDVADLVAFAVKLEG